uniref:Uncharacterized protein n=1 Tax=Anguilla anguilla TaxID=7936 RepID=A0A0E9UWY5_ANGAN
MSPHKCHLNAFQLFYTIHSNNICTILFCHWCHLYLVTK